MEYGSFLMFLLLGIVFLALIIGIPWVILLLLRKWLAKRGHSRAAKLIRVLSVLWLLFIGYSIYSSIYPTNDFYEQEFLEITGLPFPASGNIVEKEANTQDMHGDYSACALVELSTSDYNALLQQLAANTDFEEHTFDSDSTFIGSAVFFHVTKGIARSSYFKTYSKGTSNLDAYRFIGFLRNRKAIIIYRTSS